MGSFIDINDFPKPIKVFCKRCGHKYIKTGPDCKLCEKCIKKSRKIRDDNFRKFLKKKKLLNLKQEQHNSYN